MYLNCDDPFRVVFHSLDLGLRKDFHIIEFSEHFFPWLKAEQVYPILVNRPVILHNAYTQ